MPNPYRHDTTRLKAAIVARIAAGEVQRAICAEAGMPGAQTVRNWATADAGFADALAAARRRGAWTRLWAFDEARAAAFLARARAGERIHALLREPGMPSRAQYDRWRASQPAFAEAAFALLKRRDSALGERARARRRGFDQGLADRIVVGLNKGLRLDAVLASDPALPCRPTLRRWRREEPAFDRVLRRIFATWRARRTSPAATPERLAEAVLDHIVTGGSFASFSRLPGGPSRTTLRRWVRVDPDFAREVARACELREDWYLDQVHEIALRTPPGPAAETSRAVGPLRRHLARLRHRPGAVHRRGGAPGETELAPAPASPPPDFMDGWDKLGHDG